MWLTVPNWDSFQHYKDRDPKWIKVYNSLLHNPDYLALKPAERAVLHGLWLEYALSHCRVQNNPGLLTRRLGMRVTGGHLQALEQAGWIEFADKPKERKNEWASRYVSDGIRELVFTRDDYRCCECGATELLEVDHIVPISRGGSAETSNLQTLCRTCNRKKHNGSSDNLSSNSLALTRSREKEQKRSRTPKPPSAEYTCPRCGIRFKTENRLSEHLELVHELTPGVR